MIRSLLLRGWRYIAICSVSATVAGGLATTAASATSRQQSATSAVTSAKSSCRRTPIQLMTISDQTSGTTSYASAVDIPYGANAAAAAVNKTCEDGRRIQIINCNDNQTASGDT